MPFDRTQPLYQQVVDQLSARISAGTWAEGSALPAEPKLAKTLGVSQGTLRKALSMMANDGLLDRRQGVGTFVAVRSGQPSASFFVDLQGNPMATEIKSQVLLSESLPARACEALGAAADTPGWCIEQLNCLANRPAYAERIHIPQAALPGLAETHLPAPTPELWHRLAKRICDKIIVKLTPLPAPKEVAWAFDIPPGTPMMKGQQVTYDLKGDPLDYREIYVASGPWSLDASFNERENG